MLIMFHILLFYYFIPIHEKNIHNQSVFSSSFCIFENQYKTGLEIFSKIVQYRMFTNNCVYYFYSPLYKFILAPIRRVHLRGDTKQKK